MMRLENFKLGKLAPKIDHRTLKMAKYAKQLPAPPANAGYVDKVTDWGMMLNDSIGCCTCSCAGHEILQWTTYANSPVRVPDTAILRAYEAVGGYNPNNPSSDQGAIILDVLRYWRKTGIGGHKIAAYVSVDPNNITEVKQAIQLFGNVYIGVSLPVTAQNPSNGLNGNPCWSMAAPGDPNGTPGSWGGHAIPCVGFGVDSAGNTGLEVVTWGQVYDMTWGFFKTYADEAYAVLSQDWIEKDGLAPSGFNTTQLMADLAQL